MDFQNRPLCIVVVALALPTVRLVGKANFLKRQGGKCWRIQFQRWRCACNRCGVANLSTFSTFFNKNVDTVPNLCYSFFTQTICSGRNKQWLLFTVEIAVVQCPTKQWLAQAVAEACKCSKIKATIAVTASVATNTVEIATEPMASPATPALRT